MLRELTFVSERTGQVWAEPLIALLLEMNEEVRAAPPEWTRLPPRRVGVLTRKYRQLGQQGLAANPEPEPPPDAPKRRGHKPVGQVRNLRLRLDRHEVEVLAFLSDFLVPFTNHQAERDLRMEKVKQKISGSYRSEETLA